MALGSSKRWKFVFAFFAGIGVLAVVLSVLYRELPKPTEVLDRKRRAQATSVRYAVVFSPIDSLQRKRIIEAIVADIGADTLTTDFVIGSTVSDPWCASLHEYRHQLNRAMRETGLLPIGKQTLVMSMIAGFLAKSDLPAHLYLIGNLNPDDTSARSMAGIVHRTEQTVDAIRWRHGARAPVNIVSFMDTSASTINAQYINIFRTRVPQFEQR